VPLLAVNVALSITSDLAHHLVLALALLGPAFAWLAWMARRLESSRTSARGMSCAILAGAFLLRLPLLPLPLTLSDDALRYLWDGRVAAAGYNPYALSPAAERLTLLRDERWRRLPHRQVQTVYPPLSIAAFSIAARLPNPILAWKAMAAAADLAGCALLLALARRLGLPVTRTVWYAWNPLVAIELSGMAHVDALGVAACLAAVLCLVPARREPPDTLPAPSWAAAGVLSAAGVLAKLAPIAAVPMWSRQSGHPFKMLAVVGGLLAAACLPVLAATGGVPPGLLTYAVSWEFDGPVFEPLWRLLDAAGAAPLLARLLDAAKRATGEYTLWNPLYHYLYPQFLAKALLGLAALGIIAASWVRTAGAGQAGAGRAGERQGGEGQAGERQAGMRQAGEGRAGEGQAGERQAGEGQAGMRQAGEGRAGEGPVGQSPAEARGAREQPAGGWSRPALGPAAATGWLLGAILLLSATVYPWYVVWVLPWAALYRHTAWLALSGLILLSYLAQRGGVPLMPWLFAAIWVPFWVLLLGGRRWSSA